MFVWKRGFFARDPFHCFRLPRQGKFIGQLGSVWETVACWPLQKRIDRGDYRYLGGPIRPRLVLNFENYVVESVCFMNQLACVALLIGKYVSIFQSVKFFAVENGNAVHVVRGIENAKVPLSVAVERREQRNLYDNSPLGSRSKKIVEALEIRGVPAIDVELVSAACVAGSFAARPRRNIAPGCWSQIVAQNAERFARYFDVAAAKDAREVETVALKGSQVALKIDAGI